VRAHATGRPILVGTRSVAASEEVARRLQERGLEFHVLNATRLAEEAMIVAVAGERARITIATNMAGAVRTLARPGRTGAWRAACARD